MARYELANPIHINTANRRFLIAKKRGLMTKFDDFMDEFVDVVGGIPLKRKHIMSIPMVNALRKSFDDLYQRGYDDAIRQVRNCI
jgi:hypothetical protein